MKKIFIVLAAMVLMVITGCSPSGWGPASSAKAITAFSFASPAATGTITEATHTIAITVPYGTDVTALAATFATTGASVAVGSTPQISGTTANNFTSSVVYTVTAADATTQDYTVTVTVAVAASPAKAITAFTFPISTGTTIDEVAHTIAVTVPFGTVLTALVPAITHTGASISPASGVANDFTSSVVYTVTAADSSTQDYTVTVKVEMLAMVTIPAGSFQRDATPTNISTVSAFRMSQYEITRTQFSAIMGTDPSDTTYSSGMSDPVQTVTWYDAVEFCNMLSTAEGLTPVYTITGRTPATGYPITAATVTPTWANNGYRLPTEMEWMWAAMGATSGSGWTSPTYLTGYGKLFAGSDSILANGSGGTHVIGDYAWTWENSSVNDMSQPVGTKLANELGLYDMSGNVWEWCWDWYDAYPAGTQADYRGAASGTIRVLRGGGWSHTASYATVADRDITHPLTHFAIGFRVVRP